MSSKIFEYAKKAKDLEGKIKALQEKADKYKDRIKQEMERQRVTALEGEGIRITYVQTERTYYDYKTLKRELPLRLLKRITVESLDTGALQGEVLAGRIDPEVIAKASSVKLSSPYLRITLDD